MAIIDWDIEKYSVGVTLFDQHHEKLVKIINDLHDANSSDNPEETLFKIVDQLIEYTKFHFSAEEGELKNIEYNDFDNHNKAHIRFVDTIYEFKSRLESEEAALWTSMEMLSYLRDWLLTHILVTDRKYTKFFHSKGIK